MTIINQTSLAKLRKDTPGCQTVLHFNNAGAALPPRQVVDVIKKHLDLEASIGGYEAADLVLPDIETFYQAAARLISCDPQEIAFTENATRAWEMAFYSLKFKPGDRILTSVSEYASNYLAFLHKAKQTGIIIDVINDDAEGQLDIEDLKQKLNENVKLIAITHVPTQGGLVNPAVAVGKIANDYNIPYLLDTTQSVGQLPIDVNEIGCDFLCATGRKYLRGPRGTGFLYAKKAMMDQCDPPFVDLHAATWVADEEYVLRADARRFETWEQNIAAKLGLRAAINYALNIGISTIWHRIQFLAEKLREQLAQIPHLELQDLGRQKCGIVTFCSERKSVTEIREHLSRKKINVSISLQEYARLDMAKRNLPALLRASVHYYNSEEEVDVFCREVASVLSRK
ncbi:aminotransferase class V [Legionella lansingensis]|uniref:Aminotransferase class V n=1 Tax=Legionella lansingensis TaxID=45067 RepID=A0A0W0VGT4_9GAMM|nr:aminotransferase class V-fold PLP-dependent enzyme [Legionella lansingensis]KTD19259.1 aminotransferase class V [Legionella lansingensis]SNV50583.1 aminotransferase class V [Legionella lansingensis]